MVVTTVEEEITIVQGGQPGIVQGPPIYDNAGHLYQWRVDNPYVHMGA